MGSLVIPEVHRKVYEVQEIKNHRSINEKAIRKEEPEEKKRAKNEAVYEVICGG